MAEFVTKTALDSILLAGAGVCLGFMFKAIWGRLNEDTSATKNEIKQLASELQKNTVATVELRVEIKHILQSIKHIPDMQQQIQVITSKLK